MFDNAKIFKSWYSLKCTVETILDSHSTRLPTVPVIKIRSTDKKDALCK